MTPGYYLPRQRVSILYPENRRDYVGLDTLARTAAQSVSIDSRLSLPTTILTPSHQSQSQSQSLSIPIAVTSAIGSPPLSLTGATGTTSATITLGTITNIDEDLTKNPIARTLAKERRTCKSFNGEVVWPPKVEAALVQALEALLPSAIQSCVSKANLFPDRNKFCANYIKEKTGYERTPRQVGSRIQMLRGKWRGSKLFQLVALPRELDTFGNVDVSIAGAGASPPQSSNPPPTNILHSPVTPTTPGGVPHPHSHEHSLSVPPTPNPNGHSIGRVDDPAFVASINGGKKRGRSPDDGYGYDRIAFRERDRDRERRYHEDDKRYRDHGRERDRESGKREGKETVEVHHSTGSYSHSHSNGSHGYGTMTPSDGHSRPHPHSHSHGYGHRHSQNYSPTSPTYGSGRDSYYNSSNAGPSASIDVGSGGYSHSHSYSYPPPPPPDGTYTNLSPSSVIPSGLQSATASTGTYPPNSNPNQSPTPSRSYNYPQIQTQNHIHTRTQSASGTDRSPTISNPHPHPPQLQPRLMCWTDQDTEGEGEGGPSSAHPSEYPPSSNSSTHPSPVSPMRTSFTRLEPERYPAPDQSGSSAQNSVPMFDSHSGSNMHASRPTLPPIGMNTSIDASFVNSPQSGAGAGTYEPDRDHGISRSRNKTGTDTGIGIEPASSQNPPQRYVCEIELPAYLDPKSPFATNSVWGIGVGTVAGGRRRDAKERENYGRMGDVKEESMEADVVNANQKLSGVVSSAVERYISPANSNSPSHPGMNPDMDVDSLKSRSVSGISGSLSPSHSLSPSVDNTPRKKPFNSQSGSRSPRPSFTFSTTNQFTSPLPLYEWTLSRVYKDEVSQGNEAVWMALMGKHFDGGNSEGLADIKSRTSGDGVFGAGNGTNAGAVGSPNGSCGVRYDYVTEVLPSGWKKLLRPGTGVDISRYRVEQEIFTTPKPSESSMHPRPQGAAPSSVIERLLKATPTYVMEYKFYFVKDGDMYKPTPQNAEEDELASENSKYQAQGVPSPSLGRARNEREMRDGVTSIRMRAEEEIHPPGFKPLPQELPLPRLRHLSPQGYNSPGASNSGAGNSGKEYIPKQSVLPLPNFLPSLPSLLDSPSRRGQGLNRPTISSLRSSSGTYPCSGAMNESGRTGKGPYLNGDGDGRATKRIRSSSGSDGIMIPAPCSGMDIESERQMAALNLVTLQQHVPRR